MADVTRCVKCNEDVTKGRFCDADDDECVYSLSCEHTSAAKYDGERCSRCDNTGSVPCEFEHPHADHPCGRRVINGVTKCSVCGNLDGSSECEAAGCWEPVTQRDLDELIVEGMEHR